MAKAKSKFFCKECGYESSGWLGKCPSCGEWNSFVEEKITPAASGRGTWVRADEGGRESHILELDAVEGTEEIRHHSHMTELDRVLGGGFVRGSLVLIGGDPGIGKSTLLLQVCGAMSRDERSILYVSGEESPAQIRMRADRLGIDPKCIRLLPSTDYAKIEAQIIKDKPEFVVIDSIQTMYVPEISSAPGSVSQVRETAGGLLRLAKTHGITIVLVGHVTKEGSIAGPRVLEHMVDTVLYFEGEGQNSLRILRCVKNRFGSTDELGVFEMRDKGLFSIEDPSLVMLQGRPLQVAGTAVTSCMEGSRPLLIEIQALMNQSHYQQPLRMSQGIDRLRLSMLLAILQKQIKKDLGSYDCYVNVTGGIKVKEPSSDLAVVSAVLSSLEDRPLAPDLLIFGELGLAGEIRSVSQVDKRVLDAVRLGWKKFLLPSQSEKQLSRLKLPDGIELYYVSLLNEAVDVLFHS